MSKSKKAIIRLGKNPKVTKGFSDKNMFNGVVLSLWIEHLTKTTEIER